jgi:hypothetical protein
MRDDEFPLPWRVVPRPNWTQEAEPMAKVVDSSGAVVARVADEATAHRIVAFVNQLAALAAQKEKADAK